MGQPVIHIEFYARKHAQLAAWYDKMFGWTEQDFPEVNYSTGTWTQGQPGAGFNDSANGHAPGLIIPYIYTADIKADLAKLASNGATDVGEAMYMPGVGSMAHLKDPDGNVIALLQPDMPAA
jgi:uncharacterized protein